MKISFIIPVYNVQKYLDDCVLSIIKQTYKNYEILLVDDGSPDNCPELCDIWAKKEERVKALHKPNGGLSDARNYGLLHAKGEYVVFVDSDDFWLHDCDLQELVSIVEKYRDIDFVGYNCNYYYEGKKKLLPWVSYVDEMAKPTTGDKALQLLVASGTFPMSACLKMIKRKMLVDYNITFKKGQIAEDIPWFINLLNYTQSCIFVNNYVYAYRQNVLGSITTSSGERSFNSLLDIIQTEVKNMGSRKFSKEAKNSLYSFLAYEFCILLKSVSKMPTEKRDELMRLKWLLEYTANPKVRKAAFVYKYFGIKITEWAMKIYWDYIHK